MTLSRFGMHLPSVTTETYTDGEPDIFAVACKDPNIYGGTLVGGQGVLYRGTVLGMITASGKWTKYYDTSADGSQVARGILRFTTDTGTATDNEDLLVQVLVPGGNILRNDLISGADANAITDLGAHADTVTNQFRL